MPRFIPKHIKKHKDNPMSMIMPVAEARRIKRPQNCGNCAYHDFGPDGRTIECHFGPPQSALIQTKPNAPPGAVGFWPPVVSEAWCGSHKPYIATNGNGN